jgi:hypothetical protein
MGCSEANRRSSLRSYKTWHSKQMRPDAGNTATSDSAAHARTMLLEQISADALNDPTSTA